MKSHLTMGTHKKKPTFKYHVVFMGEVQQGRSIGMVIFCYSNKDIHLR